jgi:hypothetical protein
VLVLPNQIEDEVTEKEHNTFSSSKSKIVTTVAFIELEKTENVLGFGSVLVTLNEYVPEFGLELPFVLAAVFSQRSKSVPYCWSRCYIKSF